MKKEHFLGVLMGFALFLSCTNDIDSPIISPTISPIDYRISEIFIHFDDSTEENKLIFTYTNENLTLITRYQKNESNEWTEKTKQEFVYNSNLVTQTSYRKEEMEWVISSKNELIFKNNLMTEKLYHHYVNGMPGSSITTSEFSFNGTMLAEYRQYSGSFALEPNWKYDASYTNNVLTKIDFFKFSEEEWQKEQIEDFTYSGDLLNEIVYTRINGASFKKSSKLVYSYTGNLANSVNIFSWENDTWESYYTINYLYNSDDYLTNVSYSGINFEITNEKGKGNTLSVLQDPYQQLYGNFFFFFWS